MHIIIIIIILINNTITDSIIINGGRENSWGLRMTEVGHSDFERALHLQQRLHFWVAIQLDF